MRILHVSPSAARGYGGPTRSLIGYAQAAGQRGVTCVVAAPRCGGADASWLTDALPEVEIKFFDARGRGAFVYSASMLSWLSAHCRDFDVVHVHGTLNPISSLGARIALRAGIATIIRPFGTLSRYTFRHRRSQLKRAYFSALDEPNLRRCDLHFTTTAEMVEAAWHGIDFGSRAHVVPPPFTQDMPTPRPPIASSCSQRTVLFLSRLDPVKNVEALFDAWTLVQMQVSEARLVIAGDGQAEYTRSLRTRAEVLGIAQSIRFFGFADGAQKAALFRDADAFVLPSRHENFGVAVLEAIGAGLPVIVSPEVQLASFINAHAVGKIVPSEREPLAQAILDTLNDDLLRARCAERGPQLVAEHFSRERIGERLLSMYARSRAGME